MLSSRSPIPKVTESFKNTFDIDTNTRRQSLRSFSSGDSLKNGTQSVDGTRRKSIQLLPNEAVDLSDKNTISNSIGLTGDSTSETDVYGEDFLESVEEQNTTACNKYHKKVTWLTKEEEMEIVKQVNYQLRQEFRKIKNETKAKQNALRKRFKCIISDSRSILINARLDAEKVTVDKLEETALKKHEQIERKRALRKKNLLELGSSLGYDVHNFGTGEDWLKQQIDEMVSLRRIQADLDRARARKKANATLSTGLCKDRVKVSNMLNTEVRRLEKAEEVHKLVLELNSLGLREKSSKLMQSLKSKESSEIELRAKLYNENLKAKLKATKMREAEIARLRRE